VGEEGEEATMEEEEEDKIKVVVAEDLIFHVPTAALPTIRMATRLPQINKASNQAMALSLLP